MHKVREGLFPRVVSLALCVGMSFTACKHRGEDVQPPRAETPPMASPQLILLGVAGGPLAKPNQSGIATLLRVDRAAYLIDSGVGTTRQLAALGLTPPDIRTVFITHLHDDHTADLPAWLSFRFTEALSRPPPGKLRLVGPPRLDTYVMAAEQLLAVSGGIRAAEGSEFLGRESDGATALRLRDIVEVSATASGLTYEDEHIRVTAVENTHYADRGVSRPGDSASFSYRIDAPGRTLAFTGDTAPCDAVRQLVSGADVLVAEMVSDDASDLPPGLEITDAQKGHLSPLQVGELAASANVRTLVLSHYNRVTEADLRTISRVFHGKVIVGQDLLTL